jgi:hypothetical protein
MRTLREAVLAASSFYLPHRGREKSPLSGIRLIPRTEGYPARLFATKGTASILIDVEGDLPNLVADALGIEAAVRVEPDAAVKVDADLVTVGRYRFRPWCEVGVFPGFPAVPSPECFGRIPDSSLFAKVTHAVGSDPSRPELHYVSCRPGVVEATDSIRLVRVPMAINRRVWIHASVFENWPGGAVDLAVEAHAGAVFRWPGEMRWGSIYDEKSRPYPDTSKIDDPQDALQAVVSVDVLKPSVRKAAQASPMRAVAIQLGQGALDIFALMDLRSSRLAGYQDRVPALCRGEGSVVVNGAYLVSALDALDTPRVLLGLSADAAPLRVRGGVFLEYIWPMRS